MKNTPHFTTRRGFIAATGFGGVSLYGLWAAYGAAPAPLALLGLDRAHGAGVDGPAAHLPPAAGGHGGHGGHDAAAMGPSPEEFGRMSAEFIERYRLPDGSVHPRRLAAAPSVHDMHAMPGMEGMPGMQRMTAMPNISGEEPAQHTEHPGHGAASAQAPDSGPIDVLMTAGKWFYLPATLRLDVGQTYRFRMMAQDITHGASIQFGKGGRMMRLQPGRVSDTELTFMHAGRYLLNCTVYCGPAHDLMQATLEVA